MPAPLPPSFSFSGAGWLFQWHFGAAAALKERGMDTQGAHFIGTSAGSLVSAAILLDLDLRKIGSHIEQCARDTRARPIPKAFQVDKLIESTCEKFVGRERFEKYRHILEDRLTVCITNLATCQPRRITRFPTYELFVLALLASCRATPIAGFPFKMDGQWVADGGITDLQPVLSEHTVTVAPLYFGNSDIRPSRAVPIWWAVYPPGPVQVAELFELGYADASAWMDSMGYAEAKVPRAVPPHVADHLPVPTSLNRLYSLQDTPLGHAVLPQLPAHRTDPIRAAGRTTRGSVMFLGLVAELFEDGVSLLSVLAHGLMLLALFAVRPTIYVVIYLELLLRAVVAYLVLLLWPQVQSPGQATVQAHSHYHESRMACSAFLLGTYQRLVSGKRWGAWLMQRSLAARVMYITL